MTQTLSHERLKRQLHYEAETGLFIWVHCKQRPDLVGSLAGSVNKQGRAYVGVDGVRYLAHRLAWFYMTGDWPAEIDHIDRDPLNNRFCNLRLASSSQNKSNARCRSNNKLGLKGVVRHKGGYRARIKKDGVAYCLGVHVTPQAAHEAYCAAGRKLFGEFFHGGAL